MTYRDFDLIVERSGAGFRARVLSSPAGTATLEFQLPFSDLQLENLLLRLGRTSRGVRRAESSELQAARTFGAGLFAAVFTGDVELCLRQSVAESKRLGVGLRIRLRLAEPALADLPWEYLYNPAVNRFIALSVQTPLVRYIDLPEPILPFRVTPPVRILVAIASPSDYAALDTAREWERLNAALADLVANGGLAIDRLDNATLPALQKQLRKAQYHIFHFIGHGEFDQHAQEGVLILDDESGRGVRVSSQYLGMLLHDHTSLRVAVLNACEGARTSLQDPFAGSAQTLVQQGIPAVIAMQFEIADAVAGTFAHEFYGALSDGYPVDAALTEARKAIFAAGHEAEWATPVLYLRAPDGRIFDVERTETAAGRPRESAAARVPILIRDAGVALAHGRYEEALNLLQTASALDPHAANLSELIDMAEQQQAVAATRARLRREAREHVAAAADLYAKGDLAAASARLAEAFKLRPRDQEALALLARIRGARTPPAIQRSRAPRYDARMSEEPGGAPPSHPRDPAHKPSPEPERGAADAPVIDNEKDLLD